MIKKTAPVIQIRNRKRARIGIRIALLQFKMDWNQIATPQNNSISEKYVDMLVGIGDFRENSVLTR